MTIAAEQSFGPEHPSGMSPELRQGAVEQGSILSLGRDPHLLASRAGVLRTIGRPVRSASPNQVPLLSANNHFGLVVFGHTLSNAETAEFAIHFRSVSPHIELLMTFFDQRPHTTEALFDSCIRSTDGPETLVSAARTLLRTYNKIGGDSA